MTVDQVYFWEFKNRQFQPHTQAATFSFSKNPRDLKKFQKHSFHIKEQSQQKKSEIKICLIFLFLSKIGKTVFDLYKEKIIFAFKLAKEQSLFQVQPFLMLG